MNLKYLLDTSTLSAAIAAIAHVSNLILVTANVKDFARFKDLRVENWTISRSEK